jgi:hypothetical protein
MEFSWWYIYWGGYITTFILLTRNRFEVLVLNVVRQLYRTSASEVEFNAMLIKHYRTISKTVAVISAIQASVFWPVLILSGFTNINKLEQAKKEAHERWSKQNAK